MQNQKVFDKVVSHLRKQGCRAESVASGGCLYRTPTGLKCAVGCLIADEDYLVTFEGQGIRVNGDNHISDFLAERGFNLNLLNAFQLTHDEVAVKDWENSFARIAKEYGLRYSAPIDMNKA